MMKTAVLFSSVACLLSMVQLCQALTCTALTANTCIRSLYVTGQCVSGVCQCINGTVSGDFGCYRNHKPSISGRFLSGYDWIKDEVWSKQASPGYMKFYCNPSKFESGSYKWFRNNVKVEQAEKNDLHIYVGPGTWTFQCSIDIPGSETVKSDSLVMNVLKWGEPFTVKPVVTGMPKLAAVNSVFKIYCHNVPSFQGGFVFNVGGIEKREIYPETYLKMTADKFNKTVSCSVREEGETTSVTSDPVLTPASPSVEIPDVFVKGKNIYYELDVSLQLTCEFNETFVTETYVTYSWKGPKQTDLNGETRQSYFKYRPQQEDAGLYSCTASYNNVSKTSPEFKVTVEELGTNYVVTVPEKPVIGGHMALICKTRGFLPPSAQYSWNYLFGHTDNIIQINNITAKDLGRWVSCGSSLRSTTGPEGYISAPLPLSGVIQPKIEATSESDSGYIYVVKCQSEYSTPGINFEWYIDGIRQIDETANVLNFNQSKSVFSYISCRMSFNSKHSAFSKNCFIPGKGVASSPVIEVRDSPTSFITGASYTFKCSCLQQDGVTYSWKKDGEYLNNSSFYMTWQNIGTDKTGNYTCSATLVNQTIESKPLEIVVIDQIELPVIEIVASPVKKQEVVRHLDARGTYYFLCSSPARNELSRFGWRKNSKDLNIPDNILRLHDVSKRDQGLYTCTISTGDKSRESEAVAVIVGNISTPVTKVLGGVKSFIAGGNYTIGCADRLINHLPLGTITFSWKHNNTTLQVNDQFYRLDNIQAVDNGSYWCAIAIEGRMLESENQVFVHVTNEGRYCTKYKDCTGEGEEYCIGNQCQCRSDYHLQAGKCIASQGTTPVQ